MRILGIETTFDDFSIAIVENGRKVIDIETFTASKHMWKEFGGVIPKLIHELGYKGLRTVLKTIEDRNTNLYSNIDLGAVSIKPGLPSSLGIGINLSKEISNQHNIKFVGINHLEAHFFANFLNNEFPIPKQCIYIILSGGNTIAYRYSNNTFTLKAETIDIAIGDCLDKLARYLGYENAIEMDMKKIKTDYKYINLPIIKFKNGINNNFSFTGIQTSIEKQIDKLLENNIEKHFIAFSIFNELFTYIRKQIEKISESEHIYTIVLGGGVSCNTMLQDIVSRKFNTIVGHREFSTDNAAMVAACAYFQMESVSI